MPTYNRPFPVPRIRAKTFKKGIARLERIRVLEKNPILRGQAQRSLYQKNDGTVGSVSDFRKVNVQLVRKSFPIPKLSDIMQQLEGFSYANMLDLNMDYYTIRLDVRIQDVCTIITPWGVINMYVL